MRSTARCRLLELTTHLGCRRSVAENRRWVEDTHEFNNRVKKVEVGRVFGGPSMTYGLGVSLARQEHDMARAQRNAKNLQVSASPPQIIMPFHVHPVLVALPCQSDPRGIFSPLQIVQHLMSVYPDGVPSKDPNSSYAMDLLPFIKAPNDSCVPLSDSISSEANSRANTSLKTQGHTGAQCPFIPLPPDAKTCPLVSRCRSQRSPSKARMGPGYMRVDSQEPE